MAQVEYGCGISPRNAHKMNSAFGKAAMQNSIFLKEGKKMSVNLTEKAAREHQVPEQLHRIGKGLEELHIQVDKLEQRILPSLSSESHQGGKEGQDCVTLVPLAEDLNKCGERLEAAINRIGNLISRCEL